MRSICKQEVQRHRAFSSRGVQSLAQAPSASEGLSCLHLDLGLPASRTEGQHSCYVTPPGSGPWLLQLEELELILLLGMWVGEE